MDQPDDRIGTPPRERLFNAPLLAVLVAASMPVLYLFQSGSADQWIDLAFVPADLERGRWGGLVSSMLLHGNWPHVLMNAIAALTFGAPVARLLGGPAGIGAFFTLYIVSGVAGALGYGLIHLGSGDPLVGASGAIFGLIGAATRLLGGPNRPGAGRIMPLTARPVVTASIAWMAVNAVIGLIGLAPGAEGARIAWEAHAFGFLTGILMIGPLARMFGTPAPAFDSRGDMGDPRP